MALYTIRLIISVQSDDKKKKKKERHGNGTDGADGDEGDGLPGRVRRPAAAAAERRRVVQRRPVDAGQQRVGARVAHDFTGPTQTKRKPIRSRHDDPQSDTSSAYLN